jgi:hypothetical protein
MDNVVELKTHWARARYIDKRQHPRIDSDDRLFAQVVLSADDPGIIGLTFAGRASNFSLNGVQFTCAESVPPGTLLDLWIDATNRPGKFFLSGEVRWTRFSGLASSGTSGWRVGVRLRPSPATDYPVWREFLSRTAGI